MPNLVLTVVSVSCSISLLTIYAVTLFAFRKQNALLRELLDEAVRVTRTCASALEYLESREDILDAKRDAITALQAESLKAMDASLKIVNAHSSSVMRVLNSAAAAGDGSEREIRRDSAEPIVERTVGG